jgi:hypothetical protein
MPESPNNRPSVFISYSHKDRLYLERLQTYLQPYVRDGTIGFWDDTRIKPGENWKEKIEQALESAQVAILLVSAPFLASKFITEVELPTLLDAAETRGMLILPVVLTPLLYHRTNLGHFRAANDPKNPMSGLSLHRRDVVWVEVVRRVLDRLDSHEPNQLFPQISLEMPLSPSPRTPKGYESEDDHIQKTLGVLANSLEHTRIFRNHRASILAAIELLKGLPTLEYKVDPIRITVQGSTIFKSLGLQEYQSWSQARIQALKKGWAMQAYWRLDDNTRRMERWVKDTLDVLRAGVYEPFYFLERPHAYRGLLRPPYDLLLIPQSYSRPARAMLFFATKNQEHVDAAILTEDKGFYALLEEHLHQLVVSTRPLFESRPADERQMFLDEMGRRESQGGERLLVKPDLPVLTLPPQFYQDGESPWVQRARLAGWDEGQLFRLQQKRGHGLQGAVRYRDVCSKRALRKWVATRTYTAYQSLGLEMRVEPRWIAAHLRNAIEMLERNPNYEMALLDDEERGELPLASQKGDQFFTEPLWMVAGKQKEAALFIEILERADGRLKNSINLRVDEERIVRAFKSYFDSFWSYLPPKDKNKRETVAFLTSLLSLLPDS